MITIITHLRDGREVEVSGTIEEAEPDVGLGARSEDTEIRETNTGESIEVSDSEANDLSEKLVEAANSQWEDSLDL